ncbi:MAG: hydrolase [Lachnospiraceae bacterium]|jgi:predicted hydrolase (HD superfamily)|nr:hydrolase [Lachnospiraceae bacterium]NBJ80818.1 hydrolase [bacterium 1XD42-76]NBK04027.1 hydrolase [bacterium 1XD42-94]
MHTSLTREQAVELLRKYNKEPFHILHGLTVGGVLKWYAGELGFGDEADFWEICGILHDIDFEEYPEEHCLVAPRLLEEGGAERELIHAVCSHCYGHHEQITAVPEHEMEKVLYAADELTGLIGAAAKMRPSGSTKDMEVSSLRKKFKDKRFAAGCSREIITLGAEKLGWELTKLFEMTIQAMRSCEDTVKEEMEQLGLSE